MPDVPWPDASVALRVWRKITSCGSSTSEEKMGAAQIEICHECHLQRTPVARYWKSAVWRDEQLRAEPAPRHGIARLHLPIQSASETPGLAKIANHAWLIALGWPCKPDFNVARLTHFVELPLPHVSPRLNLAVIPRARVISALSLHRSPGNFGFAPLMSPSAGLVRNGRLENASLSRFHFPWLHETRCSRCNE